MRNILLGEIPGSLEKFKISKYGPYFGNFGPRALTEKVRALLYTNMTLTRTPLSSKVLILLGEIPESWEKVQISKFGSCP